MGTPSRVRAHFFKCRNTMNLSISTRWVISATLVMAAALGLGRFAYTPLLPKMVAEFDWTFAAAGDVASANFFGYMIGALLAPRISSSPQIRFWVAFSLMASAATTYLGAETGTYMAWLGVRFLSGVASALCLVLITTQLIYVLSRESTERLGNVHFAGVGIGILVCMLGVYGAGDVAQQWARLGLFAAVMMALAWFLIAPLQFARPQQQISESPGSSADSGLWQLIVGYAFFGFGYVIAATFVVAIAGGLETGGLDTVSFDARSVWVVVGLSLVPSVYVWQWVANKYGLVHTLCAAYLVESAGVLIAGVSNSYAWLVVACVLLGGTFAAITALGLSAARAAAPARIAFAISAMTVAFAVGQLLGPAVAGRMADIFGNFVWSSVVAAVLLATAALLALKTANMKINAT